MYSEVVPTSQQQEQTDATGRAAQRRRTRAAIVDATKALVRSGATPSIDEIAAAADVSRRTVYTYFPTLDQLLLDATLGVLSATSLEPRIAEQEASPDPVARVDALVRAFTRTAEETLPLGRKLIRLTVDAPAQEAPRRGYRRVSWIEDAVEPLRATHSAEQIERLVSALSVIVGWEAMVVLRDVRGLEPDREEAVLRWMAATLVRAIADESGGGPEGA